MQRNEGGGFHHTVVPGLRNLEGAAVAVVVGELGLLEKLDRRRGHGAASPGRIARRQREPGPGTAGKARTPGTRAAAAAPWHRWVAGEQLPRCLTWSCKGHWAEGSQRGAGLHRFRCREVPGWPDIRDASSKQPGQQTWGPEEETAGSAGSHRGTHHHLRKHRAAAVAAAGAAAAGNRGQ